MQVCYYKKIKYLVYYPQNFCENKSYPIILHFHGTGCKGTDIELVKKSGIIKEIANGREFNAIVIAPQCYADTWFDIFEQVKEFIHDIINTPFIDKDNVLLSGISMGGYASYMILQSMPNIFARAVICCGGGMYWNAERIKAKVLAFHGELDQIVFLNESVNMVNAINKYHKDNAKLITFPDLYHNVWDRVYSNHKTYDWLIDNLNFNGDF